MRKRLPDPCCEPKLMQLTIKERILPAEREWIGKVKIRIRKKCQSCLLYTSDAADER